MVTPLVCKCYITEVSRTTPMYIKRPANEKQQFLICQVIEKQAFFLRGIQMLSPGKAGALQSPSFVTTPHNCKRSMFFGVSLRSILHF